MKTVKKISRNRSKRTLRLARPDRSSRDTIRISAKTLGTVALPNFCERCFQLQLRVQHRLPYQKFPGIFSSIDSYSKKIVHGTFDGTGAPPAWLCELGDVVAYRDPPHHTKFNLLDDRYGILLTGTPDGIFQMADRSHLIADYKTARFTGIQDELFPIYETQLNVYARIADAGEFHPVSGLALIYLEPMTDGEDLCARCKCDGFDMGFAAKVLPVTINPAMIDPLLVRTRDIYDCATARPSREGCKDCALLKELLRTMRRRR